MGWRTKPSTGAAERAGFEIEVFWRPPGYGCRYPNEIRPTLNCEFELCPTQQIHIIRLPQTRRTTLSTHSPNAEFALDCF